MHGGLVLGIFDPLVIVFPTDRIENEHRCVSRSPCGFGEPFGEFEAFGSVKRNIARQGIFKERTLLWIESILGRRHGLEHTRLKVAGKAKLFGISTRGHHIGNELPSAIGRRAMALGCEQLEQRRLA